MKKISFILFLFCFLASAQHHSKLVVEVNDATKVLTVFQEITFNNTTNDTLNNIVLNDWNNAYSSKNTPMAKRFSDEFERSFLLSKEKEQGKTSGITIQDQNKSFLTWERNEKSPDVIQIKLKEKLLPNQKIKLSLSYTVKIQ